MNPGNNSKLNDKEFTKQYGKTTTFSYGCAPDGKEYPKSDLFVYRMTMTNEDGDVVEYPPDFMRYRCEQMGVKCVQVFCRTIIPDFYQLPDDVGSPQAVNAGEYVKKLAENFYDGPDPVGHMDGIRMCYGDDWQEPYRPGRRAFCTQGYAVHERQVRCMESR